MGVLTSRPADMRTVEELQQEVNSPSAPLRFRRSSDCRGSKIWWLVRLITSFDITKKFKKLTSPSNLVSS